MDNRELTAELIVVVTKIWNKYQNVDIITKEFGIPRDVIKKYVKYARLPKLLQDNLIHHMCLRRYSSQFLDFYVMHLDYLEVVLAVLEI